SEGRDPFPERLRQRLLVVRERYGSPRAADVGGAVGRAAARSLTQRSLGVGQAHEIHTVMKQRQHHRQQGRLLAAVERLGRGEHAGGFASERRREPQARRAVEEVLEGAAMLPKRVGLPSTSPSVSLRSSSVAYGAPLAGTGIKGPSLSADTGGTVRSRALAPAMLSMPRHTCRASSAVAPLRE